jgi:hypothetical protein
MVRADREASDETQILVDRSHDGCPDGLPEFVILFNPSHKNRELL